MKYKLTDGQAPAEAALAAAAAGREKIDLVDVITQVMKGGTDE